MGALPEGLERRIAVLEDPAYRAEEVFDDSGVLRQSAVWAVSCAAIAAVTMLIWHVS